MNSKKLLLYSSVFAIQGLSNAVIPILPELAGEGSTSLRFQVYFIPDIL